MCVSQGIPRGYSLLVLPFQQFLSTENCSKVKATKDSSSLGRKFGSLPYNKVMVTALQLPHPADTLKERKRDAIWEEGEVSLIIPI